MDYNKTINLPKTDFPMRAGLPKREPEMLKRWQEQDVYNELLKKNEGKPLFNLHDGPPFSNGGIHMGTAMNKALKDIITRSYAMRGYYTPYIPGWDNHGMPIESAIIKQNKLNHKAMSIPDFRSACHDFAQHYVGVQMDAFKRMGVIGDWEHPYLTMNPGFEAEEVKVFGAMYKKGYIYKDFKPVYWCPHDETALAEAEIEYQDDPCTTVYVKFPMHDDQGKLSHLDKSKLNFVIWTTTIWTLPGNLAIALHPQEEYAVVRADGGEMYIMARPLVEKVMKIGGVEHYEIVETHPGAFFENMLASHPFLPKTSRLVLADYVTMDSGTGCVHTAPGHGPDDYEVGLKYNLEILSPMDDAAVFLPTVPLFAGMNVFDANEPVLEKLKETGALMNCGHITHSYPCCWRCKKPLIFRATTQWFISMEKNDLRRKALDAIDNKVTWIPSWGRERIHNMIATRPDWCISRQRQWGVPIVALVCEDCGEAWNDPKWMREISDRFAKHPTGCDYWFEADLKDIVPEGLKCPHCGGQHWRKETDILDVWFDSGTTWSAVLKQRPELRYPADLYLEGSDQHRGWFHSSLLVSIGNEGIPPYKSVLTHGYVVDGKGMKMSKSLGNGIAPQELIDKYGADLVRLWVSSADYREDVRISQDIINRLVDAYRRIRNTCRYILGCVDGVKTENLLPLDKLLPLDRYAVSKAAEIYRSVQEGYQSYDFHKVYHLLHEYCVTDLSVLCIDVLKDRIYCSARNTVEFRSAVTAMYHIIELLVRDLAPILSFTADEIFDYLPDSLKEGAPTVFALKPVDCASWILPEDARGDWKVLQDVRGAVTRAIEPLRQQGVIGHALDTSITLYVSDDVRGALDRTGADLREWCIVSQIHVEGLASKPADLAEDSLSAGVAVKVDKAEGEKCPRCWIYSTEIGADPAHPDVCPRCAHMLDELDAHKEGNN